MECGGSTPPLTARLDASPPSWPGAFNQPLLFVPLNFNLNCSAE
jgi:hypothetical protein